MDSSSILSREAWPASNNASLPPAWLCNASHLSAQHVLRRMGWMQTDTGAAATESQLADTTTVVLGSVAFVAFMVLNSVERVPFLPVGRVGSSLVGALLMVIFGVVPTDTVLSLLGTNLSLLALVWGSMVLSYFLEKNGRLLCALEAACLWRPWGAWDACIRLSLATSLLSTFIGWDVGALMMSPVALKIAAHFPGQSAKPFLSAVATGANAGSILTPISNPGNVIVTLASGMPFHTFVRKMFGPWVLAVCVNAGVVVASYGNHFFGCASKNSSKASKDGEHDPDAAGSGVEPPSTASLPTGSSESVDLQRNAHESQQDMEAVHTDANSTTDIVGGTSGASATSPPPSDESVTNFPRVAFWISAAKQHWRGLFAYAVWAACLACWFADVELGAVAICGGIALIVAEGTDAAEPMAKSADWPVIGYIACILIVIPGFDMTGVMASLWESLSDGGVVSVIEPEGLVMLVIVIIVFTNIVTNVPTVLMLGARVAALASQEAQANEQLSTDSSSAAMRGWLLVSFVAAMAGSCTVQGSITQVIAYDIGKAAEGGSVSFFEHLRVGVPATILTIAVGLPLLLAEEQI